MVSSLARILDVGFKRIQFTPDLMPSDITGTNVLDEDAGGKREFRFVEGPIFTNILLADEINRTPPKTQAALLQAMQEREVTVGRTTYQLPDPFFTIATQNPIEQEGTYPLPEAQLDRFCSTFKSATRPPMKKRKFCWPHAQRTSRSQQDPDGAGHLEHSEVGAQRRGQSPRGQVCGGAGTSTRPADERAPAFVKELVDWGAGPRAGQFLINGAKAIAALDGRFSIDFGDVRRIAVPVLRHRIATNFQAQADGMSTEKIVLRLVKEMPDPPSPNLPHLHHLHKSSYHQNPTR